MEQSHGILNIVEIIQAAGKSGVKSLKYQDFEIEFFEKESLKRKRKEKVMQAGIETEEALPEQTELALERREPTQEDIDELMINDPVAFEKLAEDSLTN